jgi:hypothetical protein
LIAQCLGGLSVFHRLDAQAEWLRRAFRNAGAAPWIEGHRFPAEVGATCGSGDDCISGLCVRAAGSSFCSVRCDDAACPDGMQCVGPENDRVCSLPKVAAAVAELPVGCALAKHPGSARIDALFGAASVLGLSWLRRRSRKKASRP